MSTEIETPLLPYPITICGLAELCGHAEAGFTHVVSILDPIWPDPDEFDDWEAHRRVLWRFDDVVEVGGGYSAPRREDVQAILALGADLRNEAAARVLIHCHAGVSRSTAAAVILMAQHNPGREAAVFAELRRIRPRSWPNALMLRLADAMLHREGALLVELYRHQRGIADRYPEFAELLARFGRAHEIAALDRAR
ncbi:MAG: protein-tyrosine-phosphatase [Rhodospirillales bacterium]